MMKNYDKFEEKSIFHELYVIINCIIILLQTNELRLALQIKN